MKEKINQLIADTLDIDIERIQEETCMSDVPEWDSMMFVMILSELEEQLNISIPIEKAMEMNKVSDFYEYIEE